VAEASLREFGTVSLEDARSRLVSLADQTAIDARRLRSAKPTSTRRARFLIPDAARAHAESWASGLC
jgi:hypothetical protein